MCHMIRLQRTAGWSAAYVVVGKDDGMTDAAVQPSDRLGQGPGLYIYSCKLKV